MSQENVEAFTRGNEAANRRDVEALLEQLDPQEYRPIPSGLALPPLTVSVP